MCVCIKSLAILGRGNSFVDADQPFILFTISGQQVTPLSQKYVYSSLFRMCYFLWIVVVASRTIYLVLLCFYVESKHRYGCVEQARTHSTGSRFVERGSVIVAACEPMPLTPISIESRSCPAPRVILQMPRGNFETIYPRALVLLRLLIFIFILFLLNKLIVSAYN